MPWPMPWPLPWPMQWPLPWADVRANARTQRGSRVCCDTAPAPEEETRGSCRLAIRERLVQIKVSADTRLDLAEAYERPMAATMAPPYQPPI